MTAGEYHDLLVDFTNQFGNCKILSIESNGDRACITIDYGEDTRKVFYSIQHITEFELM